MDIKYNVVKLKGSSTEEIKDSVSVEEPLEMKLKYTFNLKLGFNKKPVANISGRTISDFSSIECLFKIEVVDLKFFSLSFHTESNCTQ